MHYRFPLYRVLGIIFVAAMTYFIIGLLQLYWIPVVMGKQPENFITIFMAGDVMTGRGIDQILPHPSDPVIHEPFMRDAVGYVNIAEEANGPIPRKVDWSYTWGSCILPALILLLVCC